MTRRRTHLDPSGIRQGTPAAEAPLPLTSDETDMAIRSALPVERGVITANAGKGKTIMMTVEEVAERWSVHPRTIRSAISKKQIVALRVGRLVRISRSHIEFLEANGDRRVL